MEAQENDYGNSGTMHESFLQTENNNEMTNSSVSDPNTPTPGWSLERVVRLVEPWKKSISESTEQIPRAKGSIKELIVIFVLKVKLFLLSLTTFHNNFLAALLKWKNISKEVQETTVTLKNEFQDSSLAATLNLVGSSSSEEKTSSLSKSDINEETEEMILAEDSYNQETSLDDPSTYPYTSDYSMTTY